MKMNFKNYAYIIFFSFQVFSVAQDAKARFEMMNTIRRDKLDLVLPGAMRDNNVDMWIHVIRTANPDPMEWYFGFMVTPPVCRVRCP